MAWAFEQVAGSAKLCGGEKWLLTLQKGMLMAFRFDFVLGLDVSRLRERICEQTVGRIIRIVR